MLSSTPSWRMAPWSSEGEAMRVWFVDWPLQAPSSDGESL